MGFKKLIVPAAAVVCLLGTSVYAAGTSSATIGYSETFAKGNVVSMSGNVTVNGYNSRDSTEDLWVEVYRESGSVLADSKKFSKMVAPAYQFNGLTFSATSGNHYLWLDPDGPNYWGCFGSGSAVN